MTTAWQLHNRRLGRLLLAMALGMGLVMAASAAQAAPIGKATIQTVPQTIPALQQWDSGHGWYRFGTGTRLLVGSAEPALARLAQTLADDLEVMTGQRPVVVPAGVSAARKGDIVLGLGKSDAELGEQGYTLEVSTFLTIQGNTDTGVFNGTRSVLQLLRQSTTIPGGTARDWPAHPVRAISIDSFPRHYSVQWWQNLIREMSYVKVNETQLLVDGTGLTKAELAEIDAFAQKYYVTVVGELNMPGHMSAALPSHPEYQLKRKDGTLDDQALDLTNPAARKWAIGLFEGYLDLFHGKYWMLGSDEYPSWNGQTDNYPMLDAYAKAQYGPDATVFDVVAAFQNEANAVVRAHGKQMRVWNDMIRQTSVVRLDKDVDVEYWIRVPYFEGQLSVQEIIDRGHGVLNVNSDILYYDMSKRNLDPQKIYEEFDTNLFQDNQPVSGDARKKVLGAEIAVWMAHTGRPMESDAELLSNLQQPMRSMSQVVWGSPKPSESYDGFRRLGERLGHAPGFLPMGNNITGDPIMATDGTGRLAWFATTDDHKLKVGLQDTAGKSPWNTVVAAKGVTGVPSVATAADGRLVIAARTTDGKLVHAWQEEAGGTSWKSTIVDLAVTSDPVLYTDAQHKLNLLVRNRGAVLVQAGPVDVGAAEWPSRVAVPGASGVPSVAVTVDGVTHVVSNTRSGYLVDARQDATGAWKQKRLNDTKVAGDPEVVLDYAKNLNFLAVSEGGSLLRGVLNSEGWKVTTLGGNVEGRVSARLDPDGRIGYSVRTADRKVRAGWQASAGSADWKSVDVGERVAGDPALTYDTGGRMLIFVRQTNGALLHARQQTPGATAFATSLLVDSVIGSPALARSAGGTDVYTITTAYGDLQLGWQTSPAGTNWGREFMVGSVASPVDTLAPTPENMPMTLIDDPFNTDTTGNYTVIKPSSWEQAPAPTVADGTLSVTGGSNFFSMLKSGVPASDQDTAVIVEADTFLENARYEEDTLLTGLVKGPQDYAVLWYNHQAGQLGFTVMSNGVRAPSWGNVSTRLVKGDKLAVTFSGKWMTAYKWHDGQWQRLFTAVVNGTYDLSDPAVRAQFNYAVGLRGDKGTISIERFQAISKR